MKLVIRILPIFFLGIGLVLFLQLYAAFREGAPNGFNRKIAPAVLSSARRYIAGSASLYIISLDSAGIKLGVANESGRILFIPYSLSKPDSTLMLLPDSIHFAWRAAKFIALDHRMFLQEGITPHIYEMNGKTFKEMADIAEFSQFDVIAPYDSGFAYRTVDSIDQQYTIRIKPRNASTIYTNGILTPQQDGYFSCDGMLLLDKLRHRFVNVYYYRNELTSFNTTFDSVFHGKTIDTVSWAKITLHSIKSERKIAFSSPPLKVNKHASIWNGLLFIYSGLRADNEMGKLAFTSSVIDVYTTSNFSYLGSFYVPDNDGEGIRDFAVYNDQLVALRGNQIYVYHINLPVIVGNK